MNVAVIGGGSWGTTLADLLAGKGENVTLWVREMELLAQIKSTGENGWYMPGVKLSPNLQVSLDLEQACAGKDLFVMAVPSQFTRGKLGDMRDFLPKNPAIVCASKGMELDTGKTMSEVCEDVMGGRKHRFAVLSGPSFAYETIRRMPTAISLGCKDKDLAREIQQAFATDSFRVYTNKDVRGVELGGAVKNIIAIAAGVSDELGFGANGRAALITRGLAEMARLGAKLGADPKTFTGLSGLGDLVLTCTGDLSRNRQVGRRLAKGQKLMDILTEMRTVAEGVKTTQAVHTLAARLKVDLPITAQVHAVLFEDKDPGQAVRDLMARSLRDE
ncbi:Glycerol-3-phosphate dehydrogenase [NAD(P)+] [Fundidesulfovibrio magnetotacticus]|uniref:Glycerol-3-phosphate dehydrogenase [NAD(P)+] n=1 Tax=Fundidesulfovibrio magnetotacticus TaxID=2730080 RepID=A0A6V8LT86_9BACT|nr:NAD(P)H-dependent glycerol-3-phosphate dehydrogenase [Fundidesulfovibrio magnetotacticus]GFK93026.1 Glycerol-3-phosphate dehydrogenase [NAD(P)+] [Fundidesulfovibrio magnetotacticus]